MVQKYTSTPGVHTRYAYKLVHVQNKVQKLQIYFSLGIVIVGMAALRAFLNLSIFNNVHQETKMLLFKFVHLFDRKEFERERQRLHFQFSLFLPISKVSLQTASHSIRMWSKNANGNFDGQRFALLVFM